MNPVNDSNLVFILVHSPHLHWVSEVEEAPVMITLHIIKDTMQDFQLNKNSQNLFTADLSQVFTKCKFLLLYKEIQAPRP